MREILFRGKRVDNGAWVEGFFVAKADPLLGIMASFILTQELDDNGILRSNMTWHKVDPETVGQYTGLTDKNGKKIFEGDIVNCVSSDYIGNPNTYQITVKDMTDYDTMVYLNYSNELEIIGNIHDNPELLEEG